jgi:hypothetical protein
MGKPRLLFYASVIIETRVSGLQLDISPFLKFIIEFLFRFLSRFQFIRTKSYCNFGF